MLPSAGPHFLASVSSHCSPVTTYSLKVLPALYPFDTTYTSGHILEAVRSLFSRADLLEKEVDNKVKHINQQRTSRLWKVSEDNKTGQGIKSGWRDSCLHLSYNILK